MNANAPANGSPVISVAYGKTIVPNARSNATAAARPSEAPKNRANRYITTQRAEVSAPMVNTIVRWVTRAQYSGSLRDIRGRNNARRRTHGTRETADVPGAFTE